MQVELSQILTVRKSKTAIINQIKNLPPAKEYMLSTRGLVDFRIALAVLEENPDGSVNITPEVAEGMSLQIGDSIRYAE